VERAGARRQGWTHAVRVDQARVGAGVWAAGAAVEKDGKLTMTMYVRVLVLAGLVLCTPCLASAASVSPTAFDDIQPGMTEAEVRRRLGEPDQVDEAASLRGLLSVACETAALSRRVPWGVLRWGAYACSRP
jgi:hypothetical protein